MTYAYTKSISEDFPSQKIHSGVLKSVIEALELSSATIQCINTDDDVCSIVFDVEPSSGDKTSVDGVVAAHTGNAPLVVTWHASSVLTDSEQTVTAIDPDWEEVGGAVTTPDFFTSNVSACKGRVVGMVKANGAGAKLRLKEGVSSPSGGYSVPDTEGGWMEMQWFAPDAPTAGTHQYTLEGQLPVSGATELKVKYVAVSLLEFS